MTGAFWTKQIEVAGALAVLHEALGYGAWTICAAPAMKAPARPWEPHKYASKEAHDASLAFLLGWIREY